MDHDTALVLVNEARKEVAFRLSDCGIGDYDFALSECEGRCGFHPVTRVLSVDDANEVFESYLRKGYSEW